MSKRLSVDFVEAMRTTEVEHGVKRRHGPSAAQPAPAETPAPFPSRPVQPSRLGKVSITFHVDPAVRKQVAQLALNTDRDQADLLCEGVNLLFERYGMPPIAGKRQKEPS